MKIALITDTHWGARNDSLLFYDYMMKFYDNIFFKELKDRHINTVIHLGDVVDRRKFINFNILHKFKNGFLKKIYDNEIDMHIIIGNHDTYFKNSNKVNAMDSLIDSNNVHSPKIYSSIETVEFDGVDICMCPWINDDNYNEVDSHISDTNADILMGHLEISGFLMNGGIKCIDGVDKSKFNKFDVVYSGHFHHKSTDGNVTYLGNPYELTWSDYKDKRGFHIFDTETRELEFIQNTYTMFEKIEYYDDMTVDYLKYTGKFVKVIVREKSDIYKFDLFIDMLYKNNVADVDIIDDIEIEDRLNENVLSLEDDTISLLSKYIDGYDVNVDKSRLKVILNDVYMDVLREM
jgi:DNA repair exonuclease SbcCD nuclease subunit